MLPSLLKQRLMILLPEIVDCPYIRIDTSALIVYHNVLYHGSLLDASPSQDDVAWARRIYNHCRLLLPVWEAEATGTAMDLVVVIMMVRLPPFILFSSLMTEAVPHSRRKFRLRPFMENLLTGFSICSVSQPS